MKNKFNIGQKIFVGGDVQEYKEIKDFEVFGDVVLYYMFDGTAYPEKFIYIDSKVWVIRSLMEMSDEKRTKKVYNYFGID